MHWISEYTRLAVDLRGEWSLRCIHMDTIVYSLQLHLQNCFPSVYDLVRDSRTTSNTEASFMFLPRWWQWRWTAGLSTGMNPHNSHKSRWRGWRSPTHKDNPDVYVCETCTMSNRIIPARPSMYRNLDAPLPSRPVAYEFIYKAISTSRRTVWPGHREYELVYQAIPWRSTCCQQWPTISFEGRPPHQRCDHHYTSLECIVTKCNVLYCRSMWHPLATCSETPKKLASSPQSPPSATGLNFVSCIPLAITQWWKQRCHVLLLCFLKAERYPSNKEVNRNKFPSSWGPKILDPWHHLRWQGHERRDDFNVAAGMDYGVASS